MATLFEALWTTYTQCCPSALRVQALLQSRGERWENDHVALRTFAVPGLDMASMMRTFIAYGYRIEGAYRFEHKKLVARHLEGPTGSPLVFVSELDPAELSKEAEAIVAGLLAQVPTGFSARSDWIVQGRPWRLSHSAYQRLASESEYAAWLAAMGFGANHFTLRCNSLRSFAEIADLNAWLRAKGFALNEAGGAIKGSPAQLLEQSSTVADTVDVEFDEGIHRVPGCYVEFAKRYTDVTGKLFTGFIEGSADKIFESTHRRSDPT